MSTYNRKGLAHSRKIITSSLGYTKPHYSTEGTLQSARRRLSENIPSSCASSVLTIREQLSRYDLPRIKNNYVENLENVRDVEQIPLEFVSISKPSAAIDRLLAKRFTDHQDAVKNMRNELAVIHTVCEQEFQNRSISVKIQINGIRNEIEKIQDKLEDTNHDYLHSENYDVIWEKVNGLLDDEKQLIVRFYNHLLNIEKKRQENVKPVLQKYYKIFHKISHLMPYEIQVYLENEILNYNEVILANHRNYADLRLQMNLLTDSAKIKFKYFMEYLKLDNRNEIRAN